MNVLPKSRAARRYTLRLAISMTLYIVLLFLSLWSLQHLHPGRAATILLALLPALPILAVLVVVGVYLKEEKDEFQRELLIQAMLWGMGGTMAAATVWGFLEANAGVPHVPAFYVFVLFWAIVGIVGVIQKFTYTAGSSGAAAFPPRCRSPRSRWCCRSDCSRPAHPQSRPS